MTDQPEITAYKATSYIVVSEEALAMAQEFQDILATALDPNAPQPPPPVDPGPNPDYHRLLAAAAVVRERPSAEVRLAVALLDLHQPEWIGYGTNYRCQADHGDDYEHWPCETVGVVAEHLGVDLGTMP